METKDNILAINAFTEYPGPRYSNQGDNSGEDFYFKILNPAFSEALESGKNLIIVLDGTAGYASSFLDEAFGNLVYDFSLNAVKSNIEIISQEEPDWREMIFNETLPEWEERRTKGDSPKLTCTHEPWNRWNSNKIETGQWR
jgi:hypothetical protein